MVKPLKQSKGATKQGAFSAGNGKKNAGVLKAKPGSGPANQQAYMKGGKKK